MMYRTLTAIVLVSAIGGLACYAQTDGLATSRVDEGVAALQQQRIKLLEDRVAILQEQVAGDRLVPMQVVPAEMDVINARLDYATSDAEKRTLLADLLGLYDRQIEVTEFLADRPVTSGRVRRAALESASDLLLLKSERLRVQILRETIGQ